MGMANFPSGIMQGINLRGLPLQVAHPGEIFWVNNTTVKAVNAIDGSDANNGDYHHPLATIDAAINKCTASRGDKIIAMPGHSETLSNATSLVLDVAGIALIGLGAGTLRPKIIMDTATTTTIPVSAANISFTNFVFSANFADIAEPFTVTATDFLLQDCKLTQEATNMNFVEIVDSGTTDDEIDGISFIRCEWIEPDTATTSLVNVDCDIDRLTILDCHINLGINGVLSSLAEVAAGKDLTNVNIRRNYVSRLVTASAVQLITFVDTTTTNTGIMEDNRCRSLDVAGELLLTAGTNISLYNNTSSSAVDASGYVLPAIDS